MKALNYIMANMEKNIYFTNKVYKSFKYAFHMPKVEVKDYGNN